MCRIPRATYFEVVFVIIVVIGVFLVVNVSIAVLCACVRANCFDIEVGVTNSKTESTLAPHLFTLRRSCCNTHLCMSQCEMCQSRVRAHAYLLLTVIVEGCPGALVFQITRGLLWSVLNLHTM